MPFKFQQITFGMFAKKMQNHVLSSPYMSIFLFYLSVFPSVISEKRGTYFRKKKDTGEFY